MSSTTTVSRETLRRSSNRLTLRFVHLNPDTVLSWLEETRPPEWTRIYLPPLILPYSLDRSWRHTVSVPDVSPVTCPTSYCCRSRTSLPKYEIYTRSCHYTLRYTLVRGVVWRTRDDKEGYRFLESRRDFVTHVVRPLIFRSPSDFRCRSETTTDRSPNIVTTTLFDGQRTSTETPNDQSSTLDPILGLRYFLLRIKKKKVPFVYGKCWPVLNLNGEQDIVICPTRS